MSRTRPGQGSSSAGSFRQFRLEAPEKPPRNHEATWNGLAQSAPRTEADWEARRRQHGFDSPQRILGTLHRLLDPKAKSDLRTIVFLARCKVDSYCAGIKPYSTVRAFFDNDKLSEVTIETYLRTVMNFIKLLDELYLSGLRHRAFELPLYVPSKVAHLRQYVEQPGTFKSYFQAPTPDPEIQGSIVPCIPFLVGLQLPDKYDLICTALRTRLFPKQEFECFLSAFRSGKLVPRLPPLPTLTPPLPIIQHFKVFDLSERLRKRALKLAGQLRGYNPAPPGVTSGADLYAYEWSTEHQAVVDEAIHCLGSLRLLVEGEYFQKTSRAIHHNSGSISTPDGKFQVIIPIPKVSKEESITKNGRMSCMVSIDSGLREIQETWNFKSGFLMNQGTSLSTQDPIDYILVRL